MRFLPNKLTALSVILMSTSAMAEAPCDFDSKDQTIYEGKIESVKLIKKNVFPYVDDTRKCSMSIEAKIKGEWYPSSGWYTFGPDMSEQDACERAENRAKVKVMRKIIPETLRSEKNLKCTLTKPKSSCRVIYMNVTMKDFGKQRVRMLSCDE